MESKPKKIILTGGGTAGSVSPLLAIVENLKNSENFYFLFLGTKNGIEKNMAGEIGLRYKAILAGKFRRYFDWQNFLDIFRIFLAFWQALFILVQEKPNLIMSAGSFAAVPVVWAAWVLRIPVIVHQMDVRPGLANKAMAPFAKIITVTFEKSLADYGKKAVWTGNPSRFAIFDLRFSKDDIIKKFNLKNNLPIVFIYGGGTGAEAINKLTEERINELCSFCQIIHSTGKGKMTSARNENYHPFEFLNAKEMQAALVVADLVVSRAGLGALTEISQFAKPAIIIPMPDSHQEDNAALLVEKNAAVVINQKTLNADFLSAAIKSLLENEVEKKRLSDEIGKIFKKGANEDVIKIIKSVCIM